MLTAEYDYEMDIEVQREEAFEHGKEIGEQNARNSINQLTHLLLRDNRIDDLKRASENPQFQTQRRCEIFSVN